MNKEDILKILEGAKDKNGDVPMRLVRQAFEKLPIECENMVSKQELLNEYYRLRENWNNADNAVDKCISVLKNWPSVTPKPELCEDAVSRKEVLNLFAHNCDHVRPYMDTWEAVKRLTPVTPKRNTGKWIVHYECPKCGEITKDFTEYCPFCNADMRGSQNEPNKQTD